MLLPDDAETHSNLGYALLDLRPRQEFYLRYALGKYFDDVRDFDQAFANSRIIHLWSMSRKNGPARC